MSYAFRPVGRVQADRSAPDDDFWGDCLSTIELTTEFSATALQGLQDFSHVEVLYLFHLVDPAKMATGARHPRGNQNWPAVGIFAQRAKNRPNGIGSTICRIVQVQGTQLVVAELDAIDGSPVLDLKPVMREFLPRGPVRQPAWCAQLMADYWRPASKDGEE